LLFSNVFSDIRTFLLKSCNLSLPEISFKKISVFGG